VYRSVSCYFFRSHSHTPGLGTLPGRSDFPCAMSFLDALSERLNLPHTFWDCSLSMDYVERQGLKPSIVSMSCVSDDPHGEIYVL